MKATAGIILQFSMPPNLFAAPTHTWRVVALLLGALAIVAAYIFLRRTTRLGGSLRGRHRRRQRTESSPRPQATPTRLG